MENRKIILGFYVVTSFVAWFMTRSLVQYLYLTFYQIRRIGGISTLREVLPVVIGLAVFLILFWNPKANTVLDEVASELKKVSWPTRTDVVRSTTVVIICILIASGILAFFDFIWGKVIGYLLKA